MTRFLILVYVLFNIIPLGAQDYPIDQNFFKLTDQFLKDFVQDGQVRYLDLKKDPSRLLEILKYVDNGELVNASADDEKAFYLNAYNMSVIKLITLHFPVSSPKDIPGFFETEKHKIAGKYYTLDQLENDLIRKTYQDPRIHFALVCGAKGCPPIINEAYKPANLDSQLEKQAKTALNDPNFIRLNESKKVLGLSKIFDWFQEDFGKGRPDLVNYINGYRNTAIPKSYSIQFYDYDWNVNALNGGNKTANKGSGGGAASAASDQPYRYFTSALYDKGQWELTLFSSLFHREGNRYIDTLSSSETFFTSTLQFVLGINPQLNVGVDLRTRNIQGNQSKAISAFNAIAYRETSFEEGEYSRSGITGIIPRVKYAPFRKVSNISIQHQLFIPLGNDQTGFDDFSDEKFFIDFDGLGFYTNVFYDQQLTDQFSIFAQLDFIIDNIVLDNPDVDEIQFAEEPMQMGIPLTLIASWFPNEEITIYGMANAAPQWWDVFPEEGNHRFNNSWNQFGLGFKYLFAQKFQVELLATDFNQNDDDKSWTGSLGLRYIMR